ncbi:hypothetical protein BC941DRAFT_439506 [Chlamydoabsidia padenii]|nr:hypothetical protein BC941DRAFT_439506 [Chlamydoabsidia padenii]
MKCIVLWQFSLLGVLAIISGLHYFVYADAVPITSNSQGLKSSHSLATTWTLASTQPLKNDKPTATLTDTKNEDSLEAQLRDDQAALTRMVTILSLIGGLGGVAIVATIIIFIKIQRRKNQEINKSNGAEDDDKTMTTKRHFTSHHGQQGSSDTPPVNFIINPHGSATEYNNNGSDNISHDPFVSTLLTTNSDDKEVATAIPQPSAPPTIYPFVPTLTTDQQQRQVISIPSQQQQRQQQQVIPSAPSAKELDSVRTLRDESGSQQTSYQGQQVGPCYYRESPIILDNTHPLAPDLPPPAYTPNPSPMYDGSHQTVNNLETTVANRAQLVTLRRHSQT